MENPTEIPNDQAAMAQSQAERWLAENQDALDSSNAFVEQHGLPLAQYRHQASAPTGPKFQR